MKSSEIPDSPVLRPLSGLLQPDGISKEPLQVRIPQSLKRRFKAHAAMLGLEPNELFVVVWQHYEATHP
jgi:hypothetical protein